MIERPKEFLVVYGENAEERDFYEYRGAQEFANILKYNATIGVMVYQRVFVGMNDNWQYHSEIDVLKSKYFWYLKPIFTRYLIEIPTLDGRRTSYSIDFETLEAAEAYQSVNFGLIYERIFAKNGWWISATIFIK